MINHYYGKNSVRSSGDSEHDNSLKRDKLRLSKMWGEVWSLVRLRLNSVSVCQTKIDTQPIAGVMLNSNWYCESCLHANLVDEIVSMPTYNNNNYCFMCVWVRVYICVYVISKFWVVDHILLLQLLWSFGPMWRFSSITTIFFRLPVDTFQACVLRSTWNCMYEGGFCCVYVTACFKQHVPITLCHNCFWLSGSSSSYLTPCYTPVSCCCICVAGVHCYWCVKWWECLFPRWMKPQHIILFAQSVRF